MRSVGRLPPRPADGCIWEICSPPCCGSVSLRAVVVLRMEDLDTQRTNAGYASQLRRDLTWLGLTWDRETTPQSQRQGPTRPPFGFGGDGASLPLLLHPQPACTGLTLLTPPMASMCMMAGAGIKTGGGPPLAACPPGGFGYRTGRSPLWDGSSGQYIENLARDCGDFVVRRADGVFVYQLAVVVDDAAAGVTEVVRGGTFSLLPPVKCTCRSFWALLSPAITMYPCSWRQTAAVCPNEMGIWTWRPCPATCLHRKSWGC